MKKVLCILEYGYEEIETVAPIDIMRRAGITVVTASTSKKRVTGRSGIEITADVLLKDISTDGYDALFLPGGPAVMTLRKNSDLLELIRKFSTEKKLIAAICAAPLLLHDAGVLGDASFTAHYTTTEELPENTGVRVAYDQNLLTSRGAGTAIDFSLKLVEKLVGEAVCAKISEEIMC